jgi:hypothetical protein
VLELVFRIERFTHFYLLNYIINIHKYLACVCANKCFADNLTFFCCFPCSSDFYGELQCINIFLTTLFFKPMWLDIYECSCTLDTLHTIRAQSQCVSTVYIHYRSSPLLLTSTRIAHSLYTVSHNTLPDPLNRCLCPPTFSCCYLRPHCSWG